jgi:hypothetical protein
MGVRSNCNGCSRSPLCLTQREETVTVGRPRAASSAPRQPAPMEEVGLTGLGNSGEGCRTVAVRRCSSAFSCRPLNLIGAQSAQGSCLTFLARFYRHSARERGSGRPDSNKGSFRREYECFRCGSSRGGASGVPSPLVQRPPRLGPHRAGRGQANEAARLVAVRDLDGHQPFVVKGRRSGPLTKEKRHV